jgi:uncharacterized protein YcbX
VEARVARISIAPVKALGLTHPESVELTVDGVPGDRRFWLLDADGRLLNNKRVGQLMAIRPTWDEATRRLVLELPHGGRVEGVVEPGETVDAVLYRNPHPSRRVPGPWAAAISEIAGEQVTLLWSESQAPDRRGGGGEVSLVSRGSLERLATEAGVDVPVDGRRFRMTFELEGAEPHAEDAWIGSRVRVGEAEILVTGDVGRCVTTTRDPDSGVSDLATLDLLARYRPEGRVEPLPFGVYASVTVPGRVRLGDAVTPV